jgi:hypothetical protein
MRRPADRDAESDVMLRAGTHAATPRRRLASIGSTPMPAARTRDAMIRHIVAAGPGMVTGRQSDSRARTLVTGGRLAASGRDGRS